MEQVLSDGTYATLLTDDSVIARVLDSSPKTDSITARLQLREAFDITSNAFNYFEHEARWSSLPLNERRPLATVALHKAFDNNQVLSYKSLMKTHAKRRIHELFGLNFVEFLQLPRARIEEMLEVAEEISKEEAKTIDGLKENLDNPVNQLDGIKK
jgi:hypothetical protein